MERIENTIVNRENTIEAMFGTLNPRNASVKIFGKIKIEYKRCKQTKLVGN
jgi:hypothetical protein